MSALSDSALKIAATQVGQLERRDNWSPRIAEYLGSVGIHTPAPWCAAFTYWCVDNACKENGVHNKVIRSGYCPSISEWASENKILFEEPKCGDFFLVYGTRARHIGLVSAVKGSGEAVDTIEGNTNLGGSPEGVGVFRRSRKNGKGIKFVRWVDLYDEDESESKPWRLLLSGKEIGTLVWSGPSLLFGIRAWCKALGLTCLWRSADQGVAFNGTLVDLDITVIGQEGYAPVRQLAEVCGLTVTNASKGTVEIRRV